VRRFFLCLALLLLSSGESSGGQIFEGVVRAVYDGDTILLATRAQDRMKVRLYGIDAPEAATPDGPGQPFGAVARRTLMYKIMGRAVSVEVVDNDQYQRVVAVIRYAGRDINGELVSEGLAWAYRQYLQAPYASQYLDAEELARRRHRGLWRDANPRPPWEFRRGLQGGKRR